MRFVLATYDYRRAVGPAGEGVEDEFAQIGKRLRRGKITKNRFWGR